MLLLVICLYFLKLETQKSLAKLSIHYSSHELSLKHTMSVLWHLKCREY
jgi:hypothetical protein